MNTGNPLGTDASGVIARQAIFHDQDRPSRLELDVACRDGIDALLHDSGA